MGKISSFVIALIALGVSAGVRGSAAIAPAPAMHDAPVAGPATFAVVIEVLGALPEPSAFDTARQDAARMMTDRGLAPAADPSRAQCMVTVIFEPDGSRRMVVHLAPPSSASPADAAGEAVAEAPDESPPAWAWSDGPDSAFDEAPYGDVFVSPGFWMPPCFVWYSHWRRPPEGPWRHADGRRFDALRASARPARSPLYAWTGRNSWTGRTLEYQRSGVQGVVPPRIAQPSPRSRAAPSKDFRS